MKRDLCFNHLDWIIIVTISLSSSLTLPILFIMITQVMILLRPDQLCDCLFHVHDNDHGNHINSYHDDHDGHEDHDDYDNHDGHDDRDPPPRDQKRCAIASPASKSHGC